MSFNENIINIEFGTSFMDRKLLNEVVFILIYCFLWTVSNLDKILRVDSRIDWILFKL